MQEALGQERRRREQLQAQLSGLIATHNSLRSKVVELEQGNAVLQRENEELHSATLPSGPSYRSACATDLHDMSSCASETALHIAPLGLPPCTRKSVAMETCLIALCHPHLLKLIIVMATRKGPVVWRIAMTTVIPPSHVPLATSPWRTWNTLPGAR